MLCSACSGLALPVFLHHFDWLNETLHSQNALRCSSFWAEKADFPHPNCVTTWFPWNATKDTPQFTGIPIDNIYLKKIDELLLHIQRLKAKIEEGNNRVIDQNTNRVDKSLDDRMVGGESYGMSRAVIDKLDLVIQQIAEANHERVEAAAAAVGVDIEGSNANGSAGGFDEDELIEFTVQQEQVQVLQKQAVDEAAKSRAAEQLTRRLSSGFTLDWLTAIGTRCRQDGSTPQKWICNKWLPSGLWAIQLSVCHPYGLYHQSMLALSIERARIWIVWRTACYLSNGLLLGKVFGVQTMQLPTGMAIQCLGFGMALLAPSCLY
jgi:hypothetical protein